MVTNAAASHAQVFWRGPQGDILVAEMRPGEDHSMNTFVGHRFIAKTSSGDVLGEYKVVQSPQSQRYVIATSDGKEL